MLHELDKELKDEAIVLPLCGMTVTSMSKARSQVDRVMKA